VGQNFFDAAAQVDEKKQIFDLYQCRSLSREKISAKADEPLDIEPVPRVLQH
jgi:hypothetical protein